jgi:small-conductance mechanosensitive channel
MFDFLTGFEFLVDKKFFETFFTNFFFNIIYFGAIFFGLFFFKKILKKKFQNHSIFKEELIKKIFSPISWLIIILFGLSFVELIINLVPSLKISSSNFLKNLPKIKKILFIINIGFSFFYFIKYFQKNYILDRKAKYEQIKLSGGEPKEINMAQIDLISKISLISLFAILGFLIIGALGINLTGLAAIGGASGLIVGFATKDLLSNFFGLFSVYLDKPFSIGDNINITDKGIKGFIEEIGLRTTKIRTYDHTMIYIPNSIFNTSIIENISRLTYRVFRYDLKIKNTKESILKIDKTIEDLKNKIYEIEVVAKIDSNPRIYTVHLNDQFVDIKFIVNLVASNQVNFEKNSHNVLNVIYNILNSENFEIIPYIPEINISGGSASSGGPSSSFSSKETKK